MGLMLVARSLERIAQHANNICEEVFYLVEGTDIRHQNAEITLSAVEPPAGLSHETDYGTAWSCVRLEQTNQLAELVQYVHVYPVILTYAGDNRPDSLTSAPSL
jgi:hypothetical protein